MAKKFDKEVLDKLDRAFQPKWKIFKKCMNKEADWKHILNEQVVLCHYKGKTYRIVVGPEKAKAHMKEKMPHLKITFHEISLNEYPAEIATGAVHMIDGRKVDVLVKHNAVRIDHGKYKYNPEGEYTGVWIHQDECGWELLFLDLRG